MTSDQLSSLLLPLGLVVIFYLLVIRPARRRQRELAATQSQVQPGSRVMLTSGMYGRVSSIGDTDIELTVAPNVTVQVHRQAIAKVVDATSTTETGRPLDAADPADSTDSSTDR